MAPPLSVIKIVKYCGVVGGGGALLALKSYKHNGAPSLSLSLLSIVVSGEGGALGSAKIVYKIMAPPLSVIKIIKYCGVVGGGRALVALKSYKHNGAPFLSLRLLSIVASGEGGAKILQKIMTPIKINKYCGVGRVCGGGHWGSAKILQKIIVPSLSVIMINKYCGVGGGVWHRGGAKILQKIKAPSFSLITVNKYCGQKI